MPKKGCLHFLANHCEGFPWVYSHGQLYVAISQATSSAKIKIFNGQGPDGYMQNVVYKEVLEM
jgi:hypothetical protein